MRNQRGALLLEHLLAVIMLAIAVPGVFTLMLIGHLAATTAREVSIATYLAQRRIEGVRAVPYDALGSTPREPADTALLRQSTWEVEVVEVDATLKEVRATVYWKARTSDRNVSLVTLVRRP